MENLRVFMVINGVAKCFFFFFEVLFFTVPVWKNGVEELLQGDQGAAQSCEANAFHQLCEECISCVFNFIFLWYDVLKFVTSYDTSFV